MHHNNQHENIYISYNYNIKYLWKVAKNFSSWHGLDLQSLVSHNEKKLLFSTQNRR